MGIALYRKYRSKTFDDVIGQGHVTKTLINAVKNGLISHAYLFTGPRGVGKTSVARVLAHAVNGLEYVDESVHLDIIEIDAASNRRIDEIRELRQKVHIAPASAKYKVYIVDEVHMLTKEAFNALLKTLEEPPAHVIFILATTEAHKLPETIISRTQRFNFKAIDRTEAVRRLYEIAKMEKISIDKEALEVIADYGNGSFRDSLGLLDQVRNSNHQKISANDIRALVGIPTLTAIEKIVQALNYGDKKSIAEQLNKLYSQGFLATQIAKQLSEVVRNQLIEGDLNIDNDLAARLLRQLLDVAISHDPTNLLEIILLTLSADKSSVDSQLAKNASKSAKPVVDRPVIPPKSSSNDDFEKSSASLNGVLNEKLWQEALKALRQNYSTLYSVARMATPKFGENSVILVFGFPFHQKRLNESKNKAILSGVIKELSGVRVSISCEIDPSRRQVNTIDASTSVAVPGPLETISNIFGGVEVLES